MSVAIIARGEEGIQTNAELAKEAVETSEAQAEDGRAACGAIW